MSGKSKSKSSNTSSKTSSTISDLRRGAVSNDTVAGMQSDLANSQWGTITPMFDGLSKMGVAMMGDNPMASMMGSMFGHQPQQTELPSLSDILQQLQQPQQPQQLQQPPQPQVNPQMGNLTPEQQAAMLNFQQYGGYGRR